MKKVVFVLGLGRTGLSVCRFLLQKGEKVVAYDDALPVEKVPRALVDSSRFSFSLPEQGEHFEEAVISPGIGPSNPLVQTFQQSGVPLVSDIEVACRYISFPLIGITGSQGKSTTVSLLGNILQEGGFRVFIGGNLGIPLCDVFNDTAGYDWGVVELSSFQLERTHTARFHIAGILNVFPNHLDRHGTMRSYAEAKYRIFDNQKNEDFSLLNGIQTAWQPPRIRSLRSRTLLFTTNGRLFEGIYFGGNQLIAMLDGKKIAISKEKWALPGRHNLENLAFAALAALTAGVTPEALERAISSFRGLPHRIELVTEKNGVYFYNDSKSTTPVATKAAVESLSGPIILLLGGRGKCRNFHQLEEILVGGKVKKAIIFGEDRLEIVKHLPQSLPREVVVDLAEAVKKAVYSATRGDKVLLSPACTSWDGYRDYEQRGEHFRRLVNGF